MDAWSDAQKCLVSAEELYGILDPKGISFVCPECDSILTPCSFRETNKRTAYFSARNGHESTCPYNSLNRKKRDNKNVETPDGPPATHPNILIFRDSPSGSTQDGRIESTTVDNEDDDVEYYSYDETHGKTCSSFKGIVDFYVKNPTLRGSELKIRGVANGTYSEIFKFIHKPKFKDGNYTYPHHSNSNVLYGMMSTHVSAKENDDKFTFTIYRKADDGTASTKRSSTYIVEVYKRKFSYKHTKIGISRYREDFRRVINSMDRDPDARIYVFFIGKQNPDSNVFIVEDLRKVCLRLLSKNDQANLYNKRMA
uniref:Uncharacterized protein n=1 Tax=Nitratidesulfovibrio vulgaris (strain DSM 19637 / Miyazaki F) TaxID=883 RepID=B8DLH0_NITV9